MRVRADATASLIRSKRENLNMTQTELARRLGWEKSQSMFVSNIENCKVQLPIKKIDKVLLTLGIDQDELIEAMALDYKNAIEDEIEEQRIQAYRKAAFDKPAKKKVKLIKKEMKSEF